jgi:transposase
MANKGRRRWTAEQKLAILEEARQTSTTISEVCRRHGVATGQFYAWEKRARQGALEGLRNGAKGRRKADQSEQLERDLDRLREVIAELSAENLALKKGRWP